MSDASGKKEMPFTKIIKESSKEQTFCWSRKDSFWKTSLRFLSE